MNLKSIARSATINVAGFTTSILVTNALLEAIDKVAPHAFDWDWNDKDLSKMDHVVSAVTAFGTIALVSVGAVAAVFVVTSGVEAVWPIQQD